MSDLPTDREHLMRMLAHEETALAEAEAVLAPLERKRNKAWTEAGKAANVVMSRRERVDEIRAALREQLAPLNEGSRS